MCSAVLCKTEVQQTLADFFDAAGLTEYADWSKSVSLTPSGREDFKPRSYQTAGLNHMAAYLPRSAIFDDPGCLSCDTEFLSPTGWKRIDEYDGEQVMQYHIDGTAEFIQPTSYVKKPCKTFLHFNSATVDQMLSSEHRVLYKNKTGAYLVRSAKDIYDKHKVSRDGFAGKFITTFKPTLTSELHYTEAELRVMVAVLADGSFSSRCKTTKQCKIELVKERKKERLRQLLTNAGIHWDERRYLPQKEGNISFHFYAPDRYKTFETFWKASVPQLSVILDEFPHWDGAIPSRERDGVEFYTTNKADADFIQYASAACGIRSTLKEKAQKGWGSKTLYRVYLCKESKYTEIRNKDRVSESIVEVPSTDGFKYCFEVPATFFIIRRNGKVVVTGNTGKSLQLQGFMIWMAGLGNKSVAIMPPVLVQQFKDSLLNTFPNIENFLTVGMVNGELKVRQKQIETYQSKGWPDILIMSYQTFLGKVKAPKRSNITATQEEALNKLPPDESVKQRQRLLHDAKARQKSDSKKFEWTPRSEITAFNFRSEVLTHLGYNLLITDESHKLKSPKSQIHQAVNDFVQPWEGDESNGLIISTGSPVETNVEDAYGLIKLLDPNRYGSARAFDDMHCELLAGVRFRKVMEYKNLDYLYQGLYARGRRITKAQAFPEMPVRLVTEISVRLSKEHKDLYDKLVEEQVLELEDKLIDATKQQRMYQYVQQILVCPERFTDNPPKENAMIEAVDGILESLEGRKVILFAWYQESIEKLKKVYRGHNPVVINGSVTGAAREKAKQTFIKDKKCKMLIANPISGGCGIDGFQSVCSYMIFTEIFPYPGGFEQAVGRLERSGQTESVNVFLLVPKGTIAIKLRNDLCRKEADANAAVRDKKTLISEMLGAEGFRGEIR